MSDSTRDTIVRGLIWTGTGLIYLILSPFLLIGYIVGKIIKTEPDI